MIRRFASFVAVVAVFAIVPPLAASAAVPLANYRSVYDLGIDSVELSESSRLKSRMVTEFTGSACAGYTTRIRFVTRSVNDSGKASVEDTRSMMFESPDGFFEFTHETFSDEKLAKRTVGSAVRKDGKVTVTLTEPEEKTFVLTGDIAFPTEQVTRMIEAGAAGQKFVAFDLYDGTDGGEVLFGTANVVGAPTTAADDLGSETAVADAGFAAMRHWPLSVSYFRRPGGTEMTPDYTMTIVAYENGVSRDVRLDYGTFALSGKLTGLEMLPTPACPE